MKRRKVTLNGYPGSLGWPKTITAEVYGALAIHRCLDPECHDCGWRVTHVPTGFALARPFKRKDEAKKALRIFATLAVRGTPVDWSAMTEERAKAMPKAVKRRLKAAMLKLGSNL